MRKTPNLNWKILIKKFATGSHASLGSKKKPKTLQDQTARLRRRVINLARDIRNIDIERDRIEERLSELAVTESQLDAQLQRDRAALSRTLAGLQALETQPPPAFAVHPDDALAAVQGAIALASIVPSMQDRAQALRSQPCRTGRHSRTYGPAICRPCARRTGRRRRPQQH